MVAVDVVLRDILAPEFLTERVVRLVFGSEGEVWRVLRLPRDVFFSDDGQLYLQPILA